MPGLTVSTATHNSITMDPEHLSAKARCFSQLYSPKTGIPTGLPEMLERVACSLSNDTQGPIKETAEELVDLAKTTRWLTMMAEKGYESPIREESDGMQRYSYAVNGLLEEYLCDLIMVKEQVAELERAGVKEGIGKRLGSALICLDAFETNILQALELDAGHVDEVAREEFRNLRVGEAYFKVLWKLL